MQGLTFNCPVCGADVPRKAKACPECGACEKSGWSEDRFEDELSLPGSTFDYQDYAARELGGPVKKTLAQRFWFFVAIIIVIAMAWMTLRGLW